MDEENQIQAETNKLVNQIERQRAIIANYKKGNNNLTVEINRIESIARDKDDHIAKNMDGKGVDITESEYLSNSSEQDDSIGDSAEIKKIIPVMERKTMEETDLKAMRDKQIQEKEERFKREQLAEIEQKRIENSLKLDRTIKIAVLDKLDKILEDKILSLKKERFNDFENLNEDDRGCPYVNFVTIKFIKPPNIEELKEDDGNKNEKQK